MKPPEIVQTEQKLTPLEERFIQMKSRRVALFTANPLCITSRNCLWYVSVHQNCPEPSPNHVENVQNIDILSFLKTFYDRHCAPYKWIFSVFGIGYDCNRIYCKIILYSVCVISTWISVINMRIGNVLLNFFVSVYFSGHRWKLRLSTSNN